MLEPNDCKIAFKPDIGGRVRTAVLSRAGRRMASNSGLLALFSSIDHLPVSFYRCEMMLPKPVLLLPSISPPMPTSTFHRHPIPNGNAQTKILWNPRILSTSSLRVIPSQAESFCLHTPPQLSRQLENLPSRISC